MRYTMKNKRQPLILFLILLFSCARHNPAYEKRTDGIRLEIRKHKVTDAGWVKVQVCTEKIIRVMASPAESFSITP